MGCLFFAQKKKKKKKKERKYCYCDTAHCMCWASLNCFSQVHLSKSDPLTWGAKPANYLVWKVGHWLGYNSYSLLVGSILSHWKILSLCFLCAYPAIPHFVLKLAILLFVLSFGIHSKIQKKKKKANFFEIFDSHY